MPPDSRIEVDFCIICDDVRREDTGKYILIGVYTNNIGVVAGHPVLPLIAALALKVNVPGTYQFRIRGRFEGTPLEEMEAVFKTEQPTTTFGTLAMQILGLRQPGMLTVDVKLPDSDWKQVRALPITIETRL